MRLTGTFKVTEVKKNTTRKVFKDLKVGDYFYINMPLEGHGRYRKHAVQMDIETEMGVKGNITLNELTGSELKNILTFEQVK